MGNVLVTGASTGIGEATALHLDRSGHRVFAGVRRAEDGDKLGSASSGRLVPVTLDVTDHEQIATAIATIEEQAEGVLHGVVNNAGIALGGPLEFMPIDDFRWQFEVNVFGLLDVTQQALPLIRRGSGRVVLVSSISGKLAVPMTGAYSASKFAVEAVGDALRAELDEWNIHVALVEPGAVKTPIWEKGRAQAAELHTKYDERAQQLYASGIESVKAGIEQQDKNGIDPVHVAEAIDHALFDPKPKIRYAVGVDAKVGAVLARLLPDRPKDFVVRKFLRP